MPRTLSLTLLAVALAAVEQSPTIIVTAERGETELDRAPVSVTVVEAGTIRDRGYVLNGHDWLREQPGVTVLNRYGGIDGSIADVRIRGVDPSFTQILVDGIPLNDPTSIGGDLNPSLINPAGISRVEVLRGPQSALYGSRALGGVIDYQSARPTRQTAGNARLTGGSFGTVGGEAVLTGPLGVSSGYAVGLSGLRSAGFSTRTDDEPGTNGDPSGYEKDGVRRTSGSARVEFHPVSEATLYAAAFGLRAHQDIDETGPDDTFAKSELRTRRFTAGGSTTAGQLRLSADAAWTDSTRTSSTNYGPPPGYAPTKQSYDGDERFVQGKAAYVPVDGLTASVGVDHRREHASQAYEGLPDDWNEIASDSGLYGQLAWDRDRIGLSLAGRVDHHSDFGNAVTGRAAAAVWPVAGVWKLRGSVANAFRAPSLYQLNGYQDFGFGSTYSGNPDLEPETALAGEVGMDWYPGDGVKVGATAFLIDYRRKIGYDLTNNTYENLDSSASSRGIEFGAELTDVGGSPVDLSSWATLLDSDDGDGNALAYVPEASGGLRATIRQEHGDWRPWQSLAVSRSTGYATQLAGGNVVDGFNLVEAAAGVSLGRTWELSLKVENLFDERYTLSSAPGSMFGPAYAYSTPGRSYYLTAAARF